MNLLKRIEGANRISVYYIVGLFVCVVIMFLSNLNLRLQNQDLNYRWQAAYDKLDDDWNRAHKGVVAGWRKSNQDLQLAYDELNKDWKQSYAKLDLNWSVRAMESGQFWREAVEWRDRENEELWENYVQARKEADVYHPQPGVVPVSGKNAFEEINIGGQGFLIFWKKQAFVEPEGKIFLVVWTPENERAQYPGPCQETENFILYEISWYGPFEYSWEYQPPGGEKQVIRHTNEG